MPHRVLADLAEALSLLQWALYLAVEVRPCRLTLPCFAPVPPASAGQCDTLWDLWPMCFVEPDHLCFLGRPARPNVPSAPDAHPHGHSSLCPLWHHAALYALTGAEPRRYHLWTAPFVWPWLCCASAVLPVCVRARLASEECLSL